MSAARIASLEARADAIATEIGLLSKSLVGGKPNNSGGQIGVDHAEYSKRLREEYEWCVKQLVLLEGIAETSHYGTV